MGAPVGNKNASRAKKWREAIMRALARKADSVDSGLDKAADKLVALAIDEGDRWAIDHIADRLDGKPAQAIVGDDDFAPIALREIVIRSVRPDTDRPAGESGSDPVSA